MEEDKELIYMYIVEYFIKVYIRVEQSTKFLCKKTLYLFIRFRRKEKVFCHGTYITRIFKILLSILNRILDMAFEYKIIFDQTRQVKSFLRIIY